MDLTIDCADSQPEDAVAVRARYQRYFDVSLRSLVALWPNDPEFGRRGFRDFIEPLVKCELFELVVQARREFARLLAESRYHGEAAEQYTLAFHTALTQEFKGADKYDQADTIREILWELFCAQLDAEHFNEAFRTADSAFYGLHRAHLGGRIVDISIHNPLRLDVIDAARDAGTYRKEWSEVIRMKEDAVSFIKEQLAAQRAAE